MFDDDVELVEKSYLKKLEEIAEKSKWVSVKDRLPEPFTTVLAHYTDGRIHTVGYLDRFMTTRGTVTHWMPLPEPPESEDDANE